MKNEFFSTPRAAIGPCPRCNVPLRFAYADSAIVGQLREIAHCPRCHHETFHELVPGRIEADPGFCLHLRPMPGPTARQLQTLRAVAPEWQELPLATLKNRLATATVMRLGPYCRKYLAEDAQRQLEAVGWECLLECVQ